MANGLPAFDFSTVAPAAGEEFLGGGAAPGGGILSLLNSLLGENPEERQKNTLALSKMLQGLSTQMGALNDSTLGPRFLDAIRQESQPPQVQITDALGDLSQLQAARILQAVGLA